MRRFDLVLGSLDCGSIVPIEISRLARLMRRLHFPPSAQGIHSKQVTASFAISVNHPG